MFPDWPVYSFLWFILLDVSIMIAYLASALQHYWTVFSDLARSPLSCLQVVQLIVLGHFNSFW